MLVSHIMQTRVTAIGPRTSIRAAAALMADRDIGVLPVCKDRVPVGILTDRDLVIRLLSDLGRVSDRAVRTVMTCPVITCRADQSVLDAARLMGARQIRRLIVCDAAGCLVGMLSLGDIARDASEELAGQGLGEIVECR
ncbi:CBS domain-containing protein [Roseovarius dicentrarchi]|uniref:CBS domain-containing protein n=1 Tax=Roseovarius dicentrarchi TaxID=2250573 RepID=UPI000DEAC9FD|nr:CBS domain-containing protein [Roseovarius dicentrarchi]